MIRSSLHYAIRYSGTCIVTLYLGLENASVRYYQQGSNGIFSTQSYRAKDSALLHLNSDLCCAVYARYRRWPCLQAMLFPPCSNTTTITPSSFSLAPPLIFHLSVSFSISAGVLCVFVSFGIPPSKEPPSPLPAVRLVPLHPSSPLPLPQRRCYARQIKTC